MSDTHAFATDIVHIVWARLRERSVELRHLVDAAVEFDGWLEGEAYLACRQRQAERGYCEVTLRPTYGSEGVTNAGGQSPEEHGALRVGGSGEPGDHRWLFAEFVLLFDRERRVEAWRTRTEAAISRLLRLGWKRSASVIVIVAAGPGDVEAEWSDDLARLAAWNRPLLTDPLRLVLPGGGTLVARAFDVKRNPSDTLSSAAVQALP